MDALFPDAFLSAIGRLSVKVRPAPPRQAVGTQLSPRHGDSLEFRDYQAYSPGDDLRRVDWAVYGRTRHLFVRRFEHPTSVPICVLLDSSVSMHLGEPSRYATAARIAAAVISAALAGQNPARLMLTDVAQAPLSISGRAGLVRCLGELAAHRKPTRIGIADAIDSAMAMMGHQAKGVVVIISDLFESAGAPRLVEALRRVPGQIVMARIVRADDADPNLAGDYQLNECETDQRLNIHADAAVIARYRRNYQDYFSVIERYAASRGSRFVSIDVASDPIAQLEPLFPGCVLNVSNRIV